MRLATWNINGMRARLPYLLRYLEAVRPDVIGLQELKMVDDAFPHVELRAAGYRALTHGQKRWNGVAILTRDADAEPTQRDVPGQEELGARLLTARVGGVSFTTVYCPNGKGVDHPDFERKLAFFDALREHWARSHPPDEPAVLCGDFNVVPAPIDSWNEEALGGAFLHTEAERARLGALLGLGLRDTYRELNADDPGHSWWDYRAGAFHARRGLRIHLLLATPPLAGRVTGAVVERAWRKKIDGMTPSDHAPVWIDVD